MVIDSINMCFRNSDHLLRHMVVLPPEVQRYLALL